MATLSTFYRKTTLLPLFKNIAICYRSIHATRLGTIYHYQGTHVTLPLKITILKRYMRSSFRMARTYLNVPKQHSVLNTLSKVSPKVRSYAVYSGNDPEPSNPDPQAKINNGAVQQGSYSFQHTEIHRVRCIDSTCQGRVCPSLCNTIKDRKAVGNFTTSKKQIGKNKNIYVGKAYKGTAKKKGKDQRANIFRKNHKTKKTPEDSQGTQLINQPNNTTQIINAEDPS